MKEQALDAGTRGALQGLIALAGALGLGALLASAFFERSGTRERNVGVAVFEAIAVVTILTAAGITAYICLLILKSDETVTSSDVSRASAPLMVALILLVLLSVASRFSSLPGGIPLHAPMITVALFAGVALGFISLFLSPGPEGLAPFSVLVIAIGGCVALLFFGLERSGVRSGQLVTRRRVLDLFEAGYRPSELSLAMATPTPYSGMPGLGVVGWVNKRRVYLDQAGSWRLRDEIARRWAGLVDGETAPPMEGPVLVRFDLKSTILPWPPKFCLVVEIQEVDGGDPATHKVSANDLGLFDVTDLNLVHPKTR